MYKQDPVLPAWLVTLPQHFVPGPALVPCLLWKPMHSACLLHWGVRMARLCLPLAFFSSLRLRTHSGCFSERWPQRLEHIICRTFLQIVDFLGYPHWSLLTTWILKSVNTDLEMVSCPLVIFAVALGWFCVCSAMGFVYLFCLRLRFTMLPGLALNLKSSCLSLIGGSDYALPHSSSFVDFWFVFPNHQPDLKLSSGYV